MNFLPRYQNFPPILAGWCLLVLTSCGGIPEHFHYIPAETIMVGKLTPASLPALWENRPAGWEESHPHWNQLVREWEKAGTKTGIAWDEDWAFFLYPDGEEVLYGMSLPLADQEAWEQWFAQVEDSVFQRFASYTAYKLDPETLLGWQEDRLIILHGQGYHARKDLGANLTTWMGQKKGEGLSKEARFMSVMEGEEPLVIWGKSDVWAESVNQNLYTISQQFIPLEVTNWKGHEWTLLPDTSGQHLQLGIQFFMQDYWSPAYAASLTGRASPELWKLRPEAPPVLAISAALDPGPLLEVGAAEGPWQKVLAGLAKQLRTQPKTLARELRGQWYLAIGENIDISERYLKTEAQMFDSTVQQFDFMQGAYVATDVALEKKVKVARRRPSQQPGIYLGLRIEEEEILDQWLESWQTQANQSPAYAIVPFDGGLSYVPREGAIVYLHRDGDQLWLTNDSSQMQAFLHPQDADEALPAPWDLHLRQTPLNLWIQGAKPDEAYALRPFLTEWPKLANWLDQVEIVRLSFDETRKDKPQLQLDVRYPEQADWGKLAAGFSIQPD